MLATKEDVIRTFSLCLFISGLLKLMDMAWFDGCSALFFVALSVVLYKAGRGGGCHGRHS